jgi:hypothetical protein
VHAIEEVPVKKKPFLITVAVVGTIGIAVFIAALGMTSKLVTVTDEFFCELSKGDYDAAYAHLSREFHGNTSVTELQAFAQESALADYSEATWWQRTIEGDEGLLDGEIETEDGEFIAFTVWFLKEDDSWKIYQIDWEGDGACTDEPDADETPVENAAPGI